jgi:hypothetical protein
MITKFKKEIAGFLLLVFTLGVIPAPLFHELFANHTDEAENHCHYYHKDLGTHIEQKQNHCDTFKGSTPLYDALKVNEDVTASLTLVSFYKDGGISSYSFSTQPNLPARAPPAA